MQSLGVILTVMSGPAAAHAVFGTGACVLQYPEQFLVGQNE